MRQRDRGQEIRDKDRRQELEEEGEERRDRDWGRDICPTRTKEHLWIGRRQM